MQADHLSVQKAYPLTGSEMEIVLLLLFAITIATIAMGIKIVPQSRKYVVTRLGAYHATLGAGVNLTIPLIERVHSDISIADQVINDVRLDVVSADNVVFGVELLVVYRIVQPELAVFRVDSVNDLVIGLVKSLVRSELGKVELDAVQSDRESLNHAIRAALTEAGQDYGVIISRSEITDVQLNEATQKAMSEVLEAERERRAAITRAEGQKRAIELRADAELYEKSKQAEAILVTANATAEANVKIGKAIEEGGLDATRFQIAQMQVDAVAQLAGSPNAKLVMIPGDVSDGFTRAAAILADASASTGGPAGGSGQRPIQRPAQARTPATPPAGA